MGDKTNATNMPQPPQEKPHKILQLPHYTWMLTCQILFIGQTTFFLLVCLLVL